MATLKLKTKKYVGQDTIDLINLRREQHLKAQIEFQQPYLENGKKEYRHSMALLVYNLALDMMRSQSAYSFYEYFDKETKEWIRFNCNAIKLRTGLAIRRNPTEEQFLKYGLSKFNRDLPL